MKDVAARYGLVPNRAGFIKCPFHKGDNTASMKLYQDNFYCYGCGVTGDVFKFVMLMENVPFKEAFELLGGTYDTTCQNDIRHRIRDAESSKRKRLKAEAEEEEKKKRLYQLGCTLNLLMDVEKASWPFSNLWCYAKNRFMIIYEQWLELWEEVNKNGE